MDFKAEQWRDRLLLVARRIRRIAFTDFAISLPSEDFPRTRKTCVGKLG